MPVFNNQLAGAAGSGGAGDYTIERSLRFDSGSSSYLSRTPSSAGNRRTFTFAFWIKKVTTSTAKRIFCCGPYTSGTGYRSFNITSNGGTPDPFYMWDYSNSYQINLVADAAHRDDSAWYHLVWAVDTTQATESDRVKLYINGTQFTNWASGAIYPSQNYETGLGLAEEMRIGVRENKTAEFLDGYLADFHYIDGSALDATSFGEFDADTGVWNPIRFSGNYGTNGFKLNFSDNSSNAALGTDSSGNNNNWTVNNIKSDAPYGVIRGGYAGSTTSAAPPSAAGWPPGLAYTAIDTSALPSGGFNTGTSNFIPASGINSFYLKMFGSNDPNGPWTHIAHWTQSETIGSSNWSSYNYLAFLAYNVSPTPSIGDHVFTVSSSLASGTNVLVQGYDRDSDNLIDSPTDYEAETGNNGGNYATFNPLHKGGSMTISDGNLFVSNTSTQLWRIQHPTIGGKTGKYYAEFTFTGNALGNIGYGVGPASENIDTYGAAISGSYCWFLESGFYTAGTYTDTSSPWTSGLSFNDIYGIAVDLDNSNVSFYRNGGLVGTKSMVNRRDEDYFIYVTIYGGLTATANFGQRPFAISSVPTGYKPLCTQSLDDPLIADPSTAFDVVTYAGNSSNQTISGLSFSPDAVWIKNRSSGTDHFFANTVIGAGYFLYPNLNNAENYDILYKLKAFNSDGFDLGGNGQVNSSSNNYVAWNFDAGSSNTTISTGSLNSSAYNTSQNWYSAGTETGQWAGAYDWQGVFESSDTSTTNGSESMATSGTTKFTFGTAVAASSNVTIISNQNVTATFKVNAGETDETSLAVAANTGVSEHVITFNGDVKNIQIESSGQYTYVTGVKIDGKLLVNTGGTIANVPSIASTCRTNQTAGFSIVSYIGSGSNATIGHGLNAKPEFAVFKARDGSNHWLVYHKSIGNDKKLNLNLNDGQSSSSTSYFQSTDPTSSFMYLGTESSGNWSGYNMIGYLFSGVENYSSFGSYTGNGSTDGPFVFTGMRSKFILIKQSSTNGQEWAIFDTERDSVNAADSILQPPDSGQEYTSSTYEIDILSNGFKLRGTNARINQSSETYIYCAFSENPFKYARAR